MTHSPLYDVLIAGAGPVGLFVARELRLADLSVLVLEKAGEPRKPAKTLPLGLRGLSAPSIETLYRRGLLDDLTPVRPTADILHWMRQTRRPGGHFAGIPFYLDQIDTAQWRHRPAGPLATTMPIELADLEAVLTRHALAAGAEIRRGVAVDALDAGDDGVRVHAGSETFRGRWLVGCDGGRSTVHKAAGFDFTGTAPEFTGYSATIELADPAALPPGRHATAAGMVTFTPPGTLAMVDFDGGAFHRAGPIGRAHVQDVLRRVSATDVTVTRVDFVTTWTDRACQATTYRRGRVLLAGDAAHIHSPLGGQGLNLGIGDAINLGWKLAATIRGDAPADLLDSYARERHPVAAQVLDWSRAQVALMRPTPGTRALAAVMRDLIATPDGATTIAERVWGIGLRYDLDDTHPLVGRSVPDIELADGRRIGPLLGAGRGLLLDFDPHAPLAGLAASWPNRITYVRADATERLGLAAMLVRPDGIVAWASDGAPDLAQARQAAARWFGA